MRRVCLVSLSSYLKFQLKGRALIGRKALIQGGGGELVNKLFT